ncbi:MAG: leucine--tRNA ligase [Patescibacteria group bacterium]
MSIAKYSHQKIEKKWQRRWEELDLYKAQDFSKKKKFYVLDMFPYPSAEGLHVGHPEGYTATDIVARYKKMSGFNVLHPMGWDAFGLPTENYAIKTGIHPKIATARNIKRIKSQIKSLGFSYDWSREINTTDPEYYKWTQWIFLQMWKKGLAYEAVVPINFCPSCKTGLANEEVIEGRCERCKTKVIKKDIRQWMLKITACAERLLKDLDLLDWPQQIKEMQKNWIGKSEGSLIQFPIFFSPPASHFPPPIVVFTTRPDTLFGTTYLVLSPEHKTISDLRFKILDFKNVEKYISKAKQKSDLERTNLAREKTGIELKGVFAINPATGKKIPIWVADYVLAHYGTGAVMAVPAHDQRDFEFAKKYELPIVEVISPKERKFVQGEGGGLESAVLTKEAYEGEGNLVNSGKFNGMESEMTRSKITKFVGGKKSVNYKLRDWVFSRQRYWGEPIPLVHCEKCGIVEVAEKDLPVRLPDVKKYKPTGTGQSPLADVKKWVSTKCPKCKGKAKRETNTMPQWAGSCWYYLAYILKKKSKIENLKSKIVNYWLPVDLYVGGAEHAVLHLLYARFWHKFLYDQGLVNTPEPFMKLRNQGLILGEDGQKMSKSRGNVINPDEVIKKYGADTMRMYEMFMGPFEEVKPWSTKGIIGIRRFLERVWNIYQKSQIPNPKFQIKSKIQNPKSKITDLNRLLHKTIKKVTEDIENFKFNTAISSMMIFVNQLSAISNQQSAINKEILEKFLQILSPFAPHLAEELWERLGHKKSIFDEAWPEYDKNLIKEDFFELVIQINGKVRDRLKAKVDISQSEALELAKNQEKIKKHIAGRKIKKVIFVHKKLINIVA